MKIVTILHSYALMAIKKSVFLVVLLAFTLVPFQAHAATGGIDWNLKFSQFYDNLGSHDIDLNKDFVRDLINWFPLCGGTYPTNLCPEPVQVTDTAITGKIWGETIGWINLNPINAPDPLPGKCNGVSHVTNACTGVLGGCAWGENTGWINFAPQNALVAPHIDLGTGQISGQVWSENYGYIELASTQTGYSGLKTTWPGCSTGSSGGSGGSGGGSSGVVLPPTTSTTGGSGSTGSTGSTSTSGTGTSGSTTSGSTGTSGNGSSSGTSSTGTTGTSGGSGSSGSSGGSSGGFSGGFTGGDITEFIGGGSSSGTSTSGTGTSGTTTSGSTGTSGSGSSGSTGSFFGIPTGGFSIPNIETIPPVVPITIGIVGLLTTVPGLIARFGGMLLTVVLYRRKRPWGVVFDAVSKEPLDPAYVSVLDAETGKEVLNQITDIDGRYGFFLKKGTYKIIVNKTNYLFPSKVLAGQMQDSVYENLYFGETFAVTGEEKVITLNVPMDPLTNDWNQEQKRRRNLLHYFTRNHALWDTLFNVAFVLGFIISIIITFTSPTWWNMLMVGFYVLIVILQSFGFGPVKTGRVTYQGAPVPYAIVRVWSASLNHEIAHRVTDEEGLYYILVPRSDVYVTVEAKNQDGVYQKIYTSPTFHAGKGVISDSFDL